MMKRILQTCFFSICLTKFVLGSEVIKAKRNKTKNSNVYDIDKLRSEDKLYKKLQEKYDNRSDLKNARLIDIVDGTVIKIIKKINFSDNEDKFEKKGIVIDEIFKGVEKNELKVFSDFKLTNEITYENLRTRLIKKENVTKKRKKRRQRDNKVNFFRYTDVDSLEIMTNMFWSEMYPDVIFDNIMVKLYIPTKKSKLNNDVVVCYIKYKEFIDFVFKRRIIVKNGKKRMLFSEALEKNELNYMYISISDGSKDYEIQQNSFLENNRFGKRILEEIKERYYAYGYLSKKM